MGTYERRKTSDGQLMFNPKAGNGETILTSERYKAKASAENGIQSVRVKSPKNDRYEHKHATCWKPYFLLKGAVGLVPADDRVVGATAKVVDKT